MGTLTSTVNHAGATVNGVLLGQPAILTAQLQQPEPGAWVEDLRFAWDDPGLPDGDIDIYGQVTPAVS